jgi:hypothetical protein
LNVRGREKQGMLESGSAGLALYQELIHETFSNLRGLDGTSLVRDVSSVAEHYRGGAISRLPDLIIRWSGVAQAQRCNSPFGPLTGELGTGRGGNHRSSGFQITMQPGVQRGAEAEPLVVTELATRVLKALAENARVD